MLLETGKGKLSAGNDRTVGIRGREAGG